MSAQLPGAADAVGAAYGAGIGATGDGDGSRGSWGSEGPHRPQVARQCDLKPRQV